MIVEIEREIVATHHTEFVAVHSEHERVELHDIVFNHNLHRHVVYHIAFFVLEHEHLRHLCKSLGVKKHKAVAMKFHRGGERRHNEIHRGVQIGTCGNIRLDDTRH